MTAHFREGQTFPGNYMLDRRLADDLWVATHTQTGDRVLIRLLRDMDDDQWHRVAQAVHSLRGLVHENISPVREAGTEQGVRYLVEPYLPSGHILDFGEDPAWPTLKQIMDALDYAHHLGIAHGRLSPASIVVDKDGTAHVTGYGLPATDAPDDREQLYLSPQVRAGAAPDIADDVFSLGCLIFRAVTGKDRQPGVEPDTPLPADIEQHLNLMLSESSFDRSPDLQSLRDALARHFAAGTGGIRAHRYYRQERAEQFRVVAPSPNRTGGIPAWLAFAGIAGILVLAAVVFLIALPEVEPKPVAAVGAADNAQPPALDQPQPPAPGAQQITPLEAARLELMAQEGERLAREILRLQLTLEDRGVLLWAPAEYEGVNLSLEQADNAYRGDRFQDALAQYEQVLETLRNLETALPETLARQIAAGDAALTRGEAQAALQAFTIAIAIDNQDAALRQRLQRAENLDTVIGLVRRGEALEQTAALTEALQAFQQAHGLDSLWQPAMDGLARVRGAITQRNFARAMSEGFRGIEAGDYAAARSGFARARQLLPGSTAPADGLLQVEQAERNERILEHRRRAEAGMAAEEWTGAIEAYKAALAISDALEFAREGLAHAQHRLALSERLQGYLKDPTLLQDNEELAAARSTLTEASRITPKSAALQGRIDTLAKLISTARTEIPVRINSDGLTHVTVRRHAALGPITSRVVYLVPGRYTLVGERPGYRDVRKDLTIVAGEPVPDVTIASTEKVAR